MSDTHLDPHLQSDEHGGAPERTTPQGTQAEGVEHGHEARDVSFGPIFGWFGGLAIFLGLTLILMRTTEGLWIEGETQERALPSPLFAQQRQIPEPRILPNPIDSGYKPMEQGQEYPESLPGEKQLEAEEAAKLGLYDPKTDEPTLPDRLVTEVASRYGGAGGAAATAVGTAGTGTGAPGGVKDEMPSDASGGTRMEDRLR